MLPTPSLFSSPFVLVSEINYRIVGNFHAGENFHGLLTVATKRHHAPEFRGENFHEWPQNVNIRKSFLTRKFLAIRYYTIHNNLPTDTFDQWL